MLITYEYPFNERVRTLLRLEDLYYRFQFFVQQASPYEHHSALGTIFEMLEVAGRADLKSDLLQELERQKQNLQSYKSNPNVQSAALNAVLAEVDQISSALMAAQGRTGQNIRDNEWLMSIRGRSIIPGGACSFDLPSYHAWQQRPGMDRYNDIMGWFAPLMPLFNAVILVLRLLRETGTRQTIVARQGCYQQMLQGKTFQLVRTLIHSELVPEISANKYMLWIRLASYNQSDAKPRPVEHDIEFDMTLCNF